MKEKVPIAAGERSLFGLLLHDLTVISGKMWVWTLSLTDFVGAEDSGGRSIDHFCKNSDDDIKEESF